MQPIRCIGVMFVLAELEPDRVGSNELRVFDSLEHRPQ